MRQAETVVEVKPWEAERHAAIAQVRQSVQGLLVLLIENHLKDEYKNRTRDLDREDACLGSELHVLSESRSTLQPILEAKSRVVQREADDFLAKGDTEGAKRKQKEAAEAEQNFDRVVGRIQQIEARRASIVGDKARIARAIWQERYESLPAASFAVLECAVDTLDALKAGMFSFQELTGLEPTDRDRGLVQRPQVERLIPDSVSDRKLAARVANWFR